MNSQVDTLIGLAKGLLADGELNEPEIYALHNWLNVNLHAVDMNPILLNLSQQIASISDDGAIDNDEIQQMTALLQAFNGGDLEVTPGELLKTTQLPLTLPKPVVTFEGKSFLFTGTFAYGTRKRCIAAVEDLGGTAIPRVSKRELYT